MATNELIYNLILIEDLDNFVENSDLFSQYKKITIHDFLISEVLEMDRKSHVLFKYIVYLFINNIIDDSKYNSIALLNRVNQELDFYEYMYNNYTQCSQFIRMFYQTSYLSVKYLFRFGLLTREQILDDKRVNKNIIINNLNELSVSDYISENDIRDIKLFYEIMGGEL